MGRQILPGYLSFRNGLLNSRSQNVLEKSFSPNKKAVREIPPRLKIKRPWEALCLPTAPISQIIYRSASRRRADSDPIKPVKEKPAAQLKVYPLIHFNSSMHNKIFYHRVNLAVKKNLGGAGIYFSPLLASPIFAAFFQIPPDEKG
jgi:hypothetical protein